MVFTLNYLRDYISLSFEIKIEIKQVAIFLKTKVLTSDS